MKIFFNPINSTKTKQYNYKNQTNPFKRQSFGLNFKGFYCDEDSFQVKKIYDLTCPSCASPMIKRKQLDQFIDSLKGKKGESLINALEKYDEYYHETEKEVVAILKDGARTSRSKSLQELINEEYYQRLQKVRKIQIETVRHLESLTKTTKGYRKDYLKRVLDNYKAKLNESDNSYFDEREFISELSNIAEGSEVLTKKVKAWSEKLPDTQDSVFIFFMRNGRNKQENSAYHLLVNSFVTCEHIKPKSKGGENNTENYLAECYECNSTRNDIPFSEWVETKPDFASNFKKYLTTVAKALDTKELDSEYDGYVDDVIQTVQKESAGKIKVASPSATSQQAPVEAKGASKEERIEAIKDDIASLKKELEEYQALKAKYEQEAEYQAMVKYIALRQQKENINLRNEKLRKTLQELQKEIDRYFLKSADFELKKQQLAEFEGSVKERSELKAKIASLNSYLSKNNIQELENQYTKTKTALEESRTKETELDSQMAELKGQFDFPSDIKAKIEELRAKIEEINLSYLKIKELSNIIKGEEGIIEQIEANEKAIAKLSEKNRTIDFSSGDSTKIEEYTKLSNLLGRIDFVKNEYLKTNLRKREPDDYMIFDFAQKQIESDIQELIKNNPNVEYQVNLNSIEKMTQEIKSLQLSIQKIQAAKTELASIKEKVKNLGTIKKLEEEISRQNLALENSQERLKATNSDEKIDYCTKEIARKKQLISTLQNNSQKPKEANNKANVGIPANILKQISSLDEKSARIEEEIAYYQSVLEKFPNTPEYNTLAQYKGLVSTKAQINSQNAEILRKMHDKNGQINLYKTKRVKISKMKERLATATLTKSEEQALKKKISILTDDLKAFDFKAARKSYIEQHEKLKQGLDFERELYRQIKELKAQIDFPDEIKARIKVLGKAPSQESFAQIKVLKTKLKKAKELFDSFEAQRRIQELQEENDKLKTTREQLLKKYN